MSPKVIEFYDFVKKNRGEQFFTNLFYLPMQVNKLYEQGKCSIIIGNDLAIILEHDGELQRLYFCANSKNLMLLPSLLEGECNKFICCDVLTKDVADIIDRVFADVGMYRYSTFVRLVRREVPKECDLDLSEVVLATEYDLKEIQSLLGNVFDKWTAHFPTDRDVLDAIIQKEIFVIRRNNRIVALAYYDTESLQKTCLKYYVVADGYRGQHLAEKVLYAKMINYNRSKTYYLWIDEKNKFGLARHHKNGFVEDGLKDHIYRFM